MEALPDHANPAHQPHRPMMQHVRSSVMGGIRSFPAYLQRLDQNFGRRFMATLFSAYFGCKGALLSLIGLAQLPFYKETLGVSGRDYQILGSIAVTPFAMKGVIGAVSDAVPLFGYHKRNYIIAVGIMGSLALVALASIELTANTAACLFFIANLEVAVIDLLCEGKFAEEMRNTPKSGADIVTWVWASTMAGSLLAATIAGPIADHGSPTTIFWVALPLAAQIVVPMLLGWLQDPRLPAPQRGVRWSKLERHPRLFFLAGLMATCALAHALVNLIWSQQPHVQLVFVLCAASGLCTLGFACLPRRLAMCNLFMFLDAALYIQIGGGLDYWFIADAECVPGGPSFDYTYYSTYVRIVGSIAMAFGVVAFQWVMGAWRFRTVFWTTTLLRSLAAMSDIVLVQRWNLWLGISDKAFFMVSNAIVYDIVYMLAFMPAVVLTSKLCPKDLEATTFALLAGFQNFGQQVSRSIGVNMLTLFGIKTTPPCDWTRLPELIAVCHMLLPLLVIPLTFVLIPDASLKENVLDETEGGGAGCAVVELHAAPRRGEEEEPETRLAGRSALQHPDASAAERSAAGTAAPSTRRSSARDGGTAPANDKIPLL